MGKEEIASYEQFLLFPQCFQKLSVMMCQNEYLWSKGLKANSTFEHRFFFLSPAKASGSKFLPYDKALTLHQTTKLGRLVHTKSIVKFVFENDRKHHRKSRKMLTSSVPR